MATPVSAKQQGSSAIGRVAYRIRAVRRAPLTLIVSSTLVLVFFGMALAAPVLAPYDYTAVHIADRFAPPSHTYLLGTDELGRDVLSRLLMGSRDIIEVAGTATLGAIFLGTVVGLLSGYVGGFIDELVMRLLEVFYSIPTLLFAMLLLAMAGSSRLNIFLVIATGYSAMVIRVVRSVVLDTKTTEYVEAAKMRGESTAYIVFREILPSVVPALVAEGCIRFAYAIFTVASLGFLGLGIQPPSPDWGLMVVEAQPYMNVAPWTMLVPAFAVAALVISVNLMADGVVNVLRARSAGESR